ncbi:MAG TPA: TlpA disulfide reductase family protein [Longimicrobiales bacterium]|nr:TlpA disulfide reductase family protein [Longimicrobiales bacterium]
MQRFYRLLTPAALAATLLLAGGPLAAQQIGLPVGTRPEPVVLQDLAGNDVDLGQYIGSKPMFVEFWATWCPLCEQLQPTVDAAHARFGDQVQFVIVAVGVGQSVASVRRHIQDHPLPGIVVFDGQGRATRAFAAPTTSYVAVLDASGRVVYTGSGGEQDLIAAISRALPATEGD